MNVLFTQVFRPFSGKAPKHFCVHWLAAKRTVLLLCTFWASMALQAQTAITVDNLKYTVYTDGTARLTGRVNNTVTDIVVPSVITYDDNTYRVTTIGASAFTGGSIDSYYNNIKSVQFQTPSNVTNIEKEAFFGTGFGSTISSNTLKSGNYKLTIPGSVKNIGEGAFCWCGMAEIEFEQGVEQIGKGTFYDCPALTKVTFPSSLRRIGQYAFMWDSRLTQVVIPEGTTSIGGFAFAFCQRMTSLQLPASLRYFGNSVLFYCRQLKDIAVADDCPILVMGEDNEEGILFNKDKSRLVFYSAEMPLDGRRYQYKVPEHVRQIGGGAFSAAGNDLKTIVLPTNLEQIDSFAFIMNPLERITIPANAELKVGSIPSLCKEIYMMGEQGPEAVSTALQPVILYPCLGITSRYYGGGISATLYTKESLVNTYQELAGKYIGSGDRSYIAAVSSKIPCTEATARELTTMCRDFDIDLDVPSDWTNGVRAYVAKEITGEEGEQLYALMKPVTYIPSRTGADNDEYTGVLLRSKAGTTFYFKMGEKDCYSGSQQLLSENNMLYGAPCYMHVEPQETDGGVLFTNYVMNEGKFRSLKSGGTLSWNRAYLRIPQSEDGAKQAVSFVFADDNLPTGIDPATTTNTPTAHDVYYTLQGQRLTGKPTTGGLYIYKGKKVLVP